VDQSQAEQRLQRANERVFDARGVDLTQIDMMLRLTPRERLEALYVTASSLARLINDGNGN